jgi:hypothetical protein
VIILYCIEIWELRQYFVLFEDGGMYTKWNVFPLCSKCSIRARFQVNPFIWLDKYLGIVTEWGLNEDRIERLISYLELQIEKAGKSNEQQTFSSIQRLHD